MKQIIVLIFLLPLIVLAQSKPEKAAKKLGPNPIIIIDSVRVANSDIKNYDPNMISVVTVLNDTSAFKMFGDEGKDGVVLIQTKPFAKKHYIHFFRTMSASYDSLYRLNQSDSTFQYILNGKIKKEKFEGDLALIDSAIFISLDILTADDLKRNYNITDKAVGVAIKSKRPEDLYHAKKKF